MIGFAFRAILSATGLSGVNLAIIAAVATAIGVVVGGLYWLWQDAKGDLQTAIENTGKLTEAVKEQKETISDLRSANDDWAAANLNLQLAYQSEREARLKASAEARRLNALFAEHDLRKLSQAKPGLVQRRLGDGTDRIFRLFECKSAGNLSDQC